MWLGRRGGGEEEEGREVICDTAGPLLPVLNVLLMNWAEIRSRVEDLEIKGRVFLWMFWGH